ncbi:MAG: sugar phosphate nucleotidyltransferase, partial [Oribacterium sp.]
YESQDDTGFYSGTANAIFQNIAYIDNYDPDYVLILSGDHIYKMDYEVMLEYHKAMNAGLTIAAMPVPMEEASRFGITVTDEQNRIIDFQEKPQEPKSNLASMGIYIFSWKLLRDALLKNRDVPGCDFGKHIIPYLFHRDAPIYAYEFNGYWKDVGTLQSYWESNMELVALIPEFNLYEEYWKIYTQTDNPAPQYISGDSHVERSIISEGCEIYGEVYNSVIGAGVTVEGGAVISDSIIMDNSVIREGSRINKAIIAQNVSIGKGCVIGTGEYADSVYDKRVYCSELALIGENSVIPDQVSIGRNTAVYGKTAPEDYPDAVLRSGGAIIKEDDRI